MAIEIPAAAWRGVSPTASEMNVVREVHPIHRARLAPVHKFAIEIRRFDIYFHAIVVASRANVDMRGHMNHVPRAGNELA